jgi:hypothetical protein
MIHVLCERRKLHRLKHILSYVLVISFALPVFMLMSCTRKDLGNKNVSKAPIADSVYTRNGNTIVALTFDTLRNSLLYAIRSQNIDGAIAFCNEQAYPITDTYSDSVIVRRTALRFRNPKNKPDSLERSVLYSMGKQMKTVKMPDTRIIRNDSTKEVHFFKPIILQPLCLNCHGIAGKQIQNSTHALIKKLYPSDQAVDYTEGDLRGVWHIIFNPQKGNAVD